MCSCTGPQQRCAVQLVIWPEMGCQMDPDTCICPRLQMPPCKLQQPTSCPPVAAMKAKTPTGHMPHHARLSRSLLQAACLQTLPSSTGADGTGSAAGTLQEMAASKPASFGCCTACCVTRNVPRKLVCPTCSWQVSGAARRAMQLQTAVPARAEASTVFCRSKHQKQKRPKSFKDKPTSRRTDAEKASITLLAGTHSLKQHMSQL